MKRSVPVGDDDHGEVRVTTYLDGVAGPQVILQLGMDHTDPLRQAFLSPGEAVVIAELLLRGARKTAGR